MDGLFNNNRLPFMLAASNMKLIDMNSPFSGALMDRVSSETKKYPISTMCTDYLGIMRGMYGITKRHISTDEKLAVISERISTFKRNGVYIFCMYQKSGMCTVDWNDFDHIWDDIERNGSLLLCLDDNYGYT